MARERAEAGIALATENGFYQFVVVGMLLRGCALADGGRIEAGIAELRGALEVLRAAGAEMGRPYYSGILTEAHGRAGQPAQGLALIEEAVGDANRTGQRLYQADLHRIKGELLIADWGMRNAESGKEDPQSAIRNPQSEAENCFRHAIDCARRQDAKYWELTAALSLSRLWRAQGKRDEARTLLVEIYGWFTEGFETRDT